MQTQRLDFVDALTQMEDLLTKNYEDFQVECQIINAEEILDEIEGLRVQLQQKEL